VHDVCTGRSRKIYRQQLWAFGLRDDADIGLDAIDRDFVAKVCDVVGIDDARIEASVVDTL
jgi:hypothetical protein